MTKKQNKRIARKNASKWVDDSNKQSMSAPKRNYGDGKTK
jgi:hypothetical protein